MGGALDARAEELAIGGTKDAMYRKTENGRETETETEMETETEAKTTHLGGLGGINRRRRERG